MEGGKKDGKTFSSFILEGDLSFYNSKIHICNIINGKTKENEINDKDNSKSNVNEIKEIL